MPRTLLPTIPLVKKNFPVGDRRSERVISAGLSTLGGDVQVDSPDEIATPGRVSGIGLWRVVLWMW
jgi:hypothetical protein